MEYFKLVFREHRDNLQNIWDMALRNLKKQFAGTVLGYSWALVRNLLFVFAYWFAINIGLKGSAKVGYPYMAWLTVGLGAWFFIKDTIAPAATSIRQNRYLVTKMVYPISIIPTFVVISSFISSLMFIAFTIVVLLISKIPFDIHWFQVIYYLFAVTMLLIALSWLTSALVVISRDVEMFIKNTIFVLFWLSPILYPMTNLSKSVAFLVKLNPFCYIIEGFRESFLYNVWFWERPVLTTYFWCFVIVTMIIGIFVHGRLRNQFVDVL